MSPNPRRGTPAGDATLQIRALARRTGRDVQDLTTLHVLESLLARVAASPYREDFVLKGGVLLAAFALRRPTRDVDLRASHLAGDAEHVAARIRDIAAISLPDGVVFDATSIRAAVIREDDAYAGIRVKLVGHLDRARVPIGIDVNFGDPIWPAPAAIELPRVVDIGLAPVALLGYPLPMVLAEKIVTAIDRGEANTRWRDYADVWAITGRHHLDGNDLATTLTVVADHRGVQLRPFLPALARMPQTVQGRWSAWRTRLRLDDELPETFADVLHAVAAFADPVISGATVGQAWAPHSRTWQ